MIFLGFIDIDFSAVLRPAEVGVKGVSFRNSIFEYRKVCDSSGSRSRERRGKRKLTLFMEKQKITLLALKKIFSKE